MTKKILALVLAVMMVVGLFTGCNSGSGEGTTAASTTKAAAGTTTAAAAGEDSILNDLGVLPLVKEPVTMTVGVRNANYVDLKTNVIWNYIQEQTGVTFEAVEFPKDEYATKVDLMMAAGGDDLPEILMGDAVTHDVRNAWGTAGFLADLKPYLDENTYNLPKVWAEKMSSWSLEDAIRVLSASDGGLYGFPQLNEGLIQAINGRIYWYVPWLEKAGMYNVDENGEFMTSLDEMVTFLKLVRDGDYNENGKQDEIPLTGVNLWWMKCGFLSAFLMNNGESAFYFDTAADKVAFNYDRPEYKEALTFINMLVEEKLLDPLAFTQDATACAATVVSDEIRVAGVIQRGNNIGLTKETVPANTDFDYTTALRAPNQTERTTYWAIAAPGSTFLVTEQCRNVALAVRIADFCATTEAAMLQAYGEEGYEWDSYENLADKENYINLYGVPVEECFYSYAKEDNNGSSRKFAESGNNVNFAWHIPYMFDMSMHSNVLVDKTKVTPLDEYHAKKTMLYKDLIDYDCILGTLNYTEEETTLNADVWSPISTYIDECFTRFCLGDLDIESEWDAYVAELYKMGLQDVIDARNTAYDRTYR